VGFFCFWVGGFFFWGGGNIRLMECLPNENNTIVIPFHVAMRHFLYFIQQCEVLNFQLRRESLKLIYFSIYLHNCVQIYHNYCTIVF